MIMEKMENDLFYNIRHLKAFKEMSGNDNGGIWCVKWKDGEDPLVYNDLDEKINFHVNDIQLAEYVASLHNMLGRLIKEVESKYGNV